MTLKASAPDGMMYNNQNKISYAAGEKLRFNGQIGNNPTFNVANQGIGTIALPAIVAGATTVVTIADTTIGSTSNVFLATQQGSTTPAAGARASLIATVKSQASGTMDIEVRNAGSADTLSTDYYLRYWVIGP